VSDTIRDQLKALGFKHSAQEKPKTEQRPAGGRPPQQGRPHDGKPQHGKPNHGRPHHGKPQHGKPNHGRPADGKPRTQEEIDLGKAYALRAQAEKAEKLRLEREAQEKAREKRERKVKLEALLNGKALNAADADVARHFPHGDKIRRIYVTADQLVKLNAGELGVVQLAGRYRLVDRETALAAKAISDEALVLLPDPNAPVEDDIPPDLVW
jgi:uncharacterized protein YaiL (DUF2058 family)